MTIRTTILSILACGLSLPALAQEQAGNGTGSALLRAMDKVSGDVTDFELSPAETQEIGRIQVTLGECRYPLANPTGEAYAYLVIRNTGDETPVFEGWMIASSPALSALDHPRYDVWVLRCITS